MSLLSRTGLSSLVIVVGAIALVSCARPAPGESEERTEVAAAAMGKGKGPPVDCLLIADDAVTGFDTIERFDALSGAYLGPFVEAGSGPLEAVRGLTFGRQSGPNGELFVLDANFGTATIAGDIFRYERPDGAFAGAVVGANDPNAPQRPWGVIMGTPHTLYVTELGDITQMDPPNPPRISRYDARTGAFLGSFGASVFSGRLRPRSIVFNKPGGDLYVSAYDPFDRRVGQILRFDGQTGAFLGVFADSATCGCDLYRPDAAVFGPDGRLYVTTFQLAEGDPDKILIFDGETGAFQDEIELAPPGGPRAFAQALLFGPGGKLYVPITGGAAANVGQVRVYDVATKAYTVLVQAAQAGGPLERPAYLTFGCTDPTTRAYKLQGQSCACGD